MTDTNAEFAAATASCRMATIALATLLLLLGIVFQLGQLGYGILPASEYWFVAMLARSLWSLLAVRSGVAALEEAFQFWPLLLIFAGLALFFRSHPTRCAVALPSSQPRSSHDE